MRMRFPGQGSQDELWLNVDQGEECVNDGGTTVAEVSGFCRHRWWPELRDKKCGARVAWQVWVQV